MSEPDKSKHSVDFDKMSAYLKKKWGTSRKCPMCEDTHWVVSNIICETRQIYPESAEYLFLPVVPVTCRNCGFVVLVNAKQAEQIPPSSPQEPKKEGDPQ